MFTNVIDTFNCDDIIIRKPARFGKRFLFNNDDNDNNNNNNNDDSNLIMIDNNGKREMIQSHPCFRLVRRSISSSSSLSPSSSSTANDGKNDQNKPHYITEYGMINQKNDEKPIIFYEQQQQRQQQNTMTKSMKIKLPKKFNLIIKIYSFLYGDGGHQQINDYDDDNDDNDQGD
mgnify:CR=1 FL=1